MKHLLKKSQLILAGLFLAAASSLCAASFEVTDEFFTYMKDAINPNQLGLKADGRFYPYSTPKGRLIGYEKPVTDKKLYKKGLSQQEAEAVLRADIEKAITDLTAYLSKNYPGKSLGSLSRKQQEMLVDYALTEGPENISPAFYRAVLNEDWGSLFGKFIYIRWVEKGWTDNPKNKAFIDRWMDIKDRQRPFQAVTLEDD